MKPKFKSDRAKSKATVMRQRNKRIDGLYLLRGYRPPEIVDILIDEGLDDGAQRDSLLRSVQARVMELREQADPKAILALQRPAETERYRQQLYAMARTELFVVENEDEVTREVASPKGDVVTVHEPRFSNDDKQKARKNYVAIVEKLAVLNGVSVKGLSLSDEEAAEASKKQGDTRQFVFNVSGKSLDSLLGERTGRGGPVN
jgi:hypothetical protein